MGLTIGIAGLPNVGKSTLFNALTSSDAPAANYPFATIEPNTGVVGVPDPRLPVLAGMFGSGRTVPATVTFVDIAGLVKGASEGHGLGNRFLAHIREADAVCQVVRVFEDTDVAHVEGRISPSDDIETVNTELILADLQTIDRVLPRLEKEARTHKDRLPELRAVERARQTLDSGTTVFAAGLDPEPLRDLHLLTAKPFLYVFNLDERELLDSGTRADLRKLVAPADAIFLNAQLEAELIEMPPDEAQELLRAMGQEEPGLHQVARAGFDTLGLQTFLTVAPKEARAWTIRKGMTAWDAAGVVHTDFQRGFIKAEVVSYDELAAAGGYADARALGQVRIEGKDYVMREGDVVEFRTGITSGGKR